MIRKRKFTCRYDLHDIVAVFSLWHMGCDATWLDGCTGWVENCLGQAQEYLDDDGG